MACAPMPTLTPSVVLRGMLCVATCATALTAQRNEWLVDWAGGAGVHFVDLPPAIATAAPGDLIVVRPGTYHGFSTSKGVSVVAASTATRWPILLPPTSSATATVEVVGLPGNERFSLVGCELTMPANGGAGFVARDAQGIVHVESCNIELTATTTSTTPWPALQGVRCPRLIVERTVLQGYPAVWLDTCELLAQQVHMFGIDGGVFAPGPADLPGHGVFARASAVELTRCTIVGGDALGLALGVQAGSGIVSDASTWILRGDGNGSIVAGSTPAGPTTAARGTGQVRYDPWFTVAGSRGGAQFDATLTTTVQRMPALSLVYLPVLGTTRVDLPGVSGEAYAMLIGLPGDPIAVPGLGDLRLGLQVGPFTVASGVIDASGWASITVPIGTVPELRGVLFGWQALRAGPQGIALSNLATYLHR